MPRTGDKRPPSEEESDDDLFITQKPVEKKMKKEPPPPQSIYEKLKALSDANGGTLYYSQITSDRYNRAKQEVKALTSKAERKAFKASFKCFFFKNQAEYDNFTLPDDGYVKKTRQFDDKKLHALADYVAKKIRTETIVGLSL